MGNQRFSITPAVAVSDDRVSDAQFRTLAALGVYGDKHGWMFPSLTTLGGMLHKTKQAISKDIKNLRLLGYLEIKPQYKDDGSRRPNKIRMLFDNLPPEQDGGVSTSEVDGVSTSEVDGVSTSEVDVNDPSNAPLNEYACEETASVEETEQPALPTMPTVAKPLTVKKPRQLMTEEETAVVNVWTNVNIQPPIPANDAPASEFKAFRKLWLSPVQQVIKAANGRSKEVILKAIQEQKRKGIAYGQPVSVLKRALEIAAELTPVKPAGEVTAAQAAAAIAAKTGIQFDD